MPPLTRGELAAMLAALMLTLGVPREVTAHRLCKADGARCKTNQSCCSGICTALVCGTPTTTTSSTTTTSTTSSTTTTTLRFVDNGDGTVTDNQTGLQWEQKVAGSSCLHCVNDTYIWSSSGSAPRVIRTPDLLIRSRRPRRAIGLHPAHPGVIAHYTPAVAPGEAG